MQEYIHHTLRTVTASPSTVVKNTSVSSCQKQNDVCENKQIWALSMRMWVT